MLPMSTKQAITFHLNSLNGKKGKTYDIVENPGPGLEQAHDTCGGPKPVIQI